MLQQYRKKWDEKNNVYLNHEVHDASSHPADAFRYLALGIQEEQRPRQRKRPKGYVDILAR